jgi:hypothetical protein
MTEEELERQARLWHVESTLEKEKTAALSMQLAAALPQARTRRRWQFAGVALVLTSLPLGGVATIILRTATQARQTRIDFLGSLPKFMMHPPQLGSDGTVLLTEPTASYGIGQDATTEQYLVQPNSNTRERVIIPISLFPESKYHNINFKITSIRSRGELVGTVHWHSTQLRNSWESKSILIRGKNYKILPPLPGYSSSFNFYYSSQGLTGDSWRTKGTVVDSQRTLWRDGKPEPLNDTPFISEGIDSKNKQAFVAVSRDINKNGVRVGIITYGSTGQGAIWKSASEKPQPLWEKPAVFGATCVTCDSIDDEGRVVGMMTEPFSESLTPYVWKDGRYMSLQALLPQKSGWQLTSVTKVKGRFVIGEGEFHGKKSYYRLTLPSNYP